MKRLIAYSLLLIAFLISGCIIRMTPYDVNRVDQDIKGNRGIIRGQLSGVPEAKDIKKTKRMYNIEIELPSDADRYLKNKDVESMGGNKGYIRTGKTNASQIVYQAPVTIDKKYQKEKGAGALVEKKNIEAPKAYVVKKGDTLQKISQQIYGTTKQWKTIYEANRGTLKSPDLIKPGQELVIP